jgi:hypothetical protein
MRVSSRNERQHIDPRKRTYLRARFQLLITRAMLTPSLACKGWRLGGYRALARNTGKHPMLFNSTIRLSLMIVSALLLTQFSTATAETNSGEIFRKCEAYGADVRSKCERDSCGGACTLEAYKRCSRIGTNASNACVVKSDQVFISPGVDNRRKPEGPRQVRQPDSDNPKGPGKPQTPQKRQQQHLQSNSSSNGEPPLR